MSACNSVRCYGAREAGIVGTCATGESITLGPRPSGALLQTRKMITQGEKGVAGAGAVVLRVQRLDQQLGFRLGIYA